MDRVHISLPIARCDNLLSWDADAIARLLGHARRAAMRVGIHIEEEEFLREIEARGGQVDWTRRAVVPTEAQLDEVCAAMKRTTPVAGAPAPVRSQGYEPVGVGNGGNMLFDWDQWAARAPTLADLIWVCHWAQGCDDVGSLVDPFMIKDVDQRLEPLITYAVMARHCHKKVWHPQPTEPEHVIYLDRMARIVEQHRGYYQPMLHMEYVNPPFRLGGRAIRTMLARVDTGICDKMGIGPMTVSGMSAPVTVAGTAVTAVAEVLAALNALHVLRPAPGLTAVSCTGELDIATARVKYFAFRTHLQNLAVAEIIRRGIGAECSHLTWYRDANEPGLQACYEYGYSQALFSALKERAFPEVGGLACGNTFSPEQALLDIEILKEFDDLLRGFDASDESVALGDILAAGFEQGYHLTSEHMLAHLREHVPLSNFFPRGYPAGAGHTKGESQTEQLMRSARERSLAAWRKGREVEPDAALGDALRDIVVEAAARMGADLPPGL